MADNDTPTRPAEPRPSGGVSRGWAPVVALVVVLLLALGLRIYLATSPGYASDLQWFHSWASAIQKGDLSSPYELPGRQACNYPPGYVLVLSWLPSIYEVFHADPFHIPPDPEAKRFDPVDRTLGIIGGPRKKLGKLRDLIVNYPDHADSEKYRKLMLSTLVQETRQYRGALISPTEFNEMMRSLPQNPDRFQEILNRVPERIDRLVGKLMPYEVPSRVRRIAVWVKLPALIIDLAAGLVLVLLLRGRIGAWGSVGVAAIYLALPAVWYDSGYWGQVDAVHALMMLLAVALLIRGHTFLVGLLFVAALLTKLQAIVIAPVLLAGFVRRWRDMLVGTDGAGSDGGPQAVLRSIGLGVLGAITGGAVILLPFALDGAVELALGIYGKVTSQYNWVSVCAYNPWWLWNSVPALPQWYYVFTPKDDVGWIGPLTAKTIGIGLLGLYSLWVMWMIYRRGCTYGPVAAGAAAMAMAFFCLPTEIHERYGFPAILLGMYLVGMGWRHLPIVVLLSIAQFYNLTAVQPVEDPWFAWLAPVANAFEGQAWFTYVLVLIHVSSLIYFTLVLYRLGVRPPAREGGARDARAWDEGRQVEGGRGGSSRKKRRRMR